MKSPKSIVKIILCVLVSVVLLACTQGPKFSYESDIATAALLNRQPPDFPETNFAVISDLHLYPLSLGTEGSAFQEYIIKDRKLIKESSEILESAISVINNEKVNFVLVPGDLTKDGERASHDLAASYLKQIAAGGKQVFVIPGNHDIRNGLSFEYSSNGAERVPNITADEFAQIYNEFGYRQAIDRDTNSLSYVVEPQAGLWLLALDSCRYAENQENKKCITDGKFSPATLTWLEQTLIEAVKNNKAVIVMMHHSIVEHYKGQEKDFGDYIVDDYPAISKLMAMYNVRLVFTGHYHAQDITVSRWPENNKFLFDIETGSLVTHPCPYRIVRIDSSQKAAVRSSKVTKTKNHPVDFEKYTYQYTFEGIKNIASNTIQGYKVDKAEADSLAGQVALGFMAHYAGDERLSPNTEPLRTTGLSLAGWVVVNVRQDLVRSLWQDLEPTDNNVIIDLKTGQAR